MLPHRLLVTTNFILRNDALLTAQLFTHMDVYYCQLITLNLQMTLS